MGGYTLSWPGHLLLRINTGLRRADLEPHRTAPIPTLHISTCWHLREVVLCRSWVVDLLRGDVIDYRACRNGHDVRSIGGGVAADVGDGRILDALLCVGVLGLAGCGPVFLFGFAIYDEAGESVWLG